MTSSAIKIETHGTCHSDMLSGFCAVGEGCLLTSRLAYRNQGVGIITTYATQPCLTYLEKNRCAVSAISNLCLSLKCVTTLCSAKCGKSQKFDMCISCSAKSLACSKMLQCCENFRVCFCHQYTPDQSSRSSRQSVRQASEESNVLYM